PPITSHIYNLSLHDALPISCKNYIPFYSSTVNYFFRFFYFSVQTDIHLEGLRRNLKNKYQYLFYIDKISYQIYYSIVIYHCYMEVFMDERTSSTLENIQQAALEEFSEKGFLGASLRQIVKNAGVTTGAFYGYFSSKEALFASIVEPHAAALMGRF